MTTKLLLTTAASTLAFAGIAAAQDSQTPYTDEAGGFYVGGGYTFIDIETDSDIEAFDDVGDNTNALTARVGYQFTPVFSFEADGTFGIDNGDFDLDGDEIDLGDLDLADENAEADDLDSALATGGDLGLDYLFGAYVRAGFPVNERFTVSGRAGYALAEIDVTNTFTTTSTDAEGATVTNTVSRSVGGSDDGFAFGASARYNFTGASAIRADYTRYNFGEANADAITLSYQHTFGGPAAGY